MTLSFLSNEKIRSTDRIVIAERRNIWIIKLCSWRSTAIRIRTSDKISQMLFILYGKNFPSNTKVECWWFAGNTRTKIWFWMVCFAHTMSSTHFQLHESEIKWHILHFRFYFTIYVFLSLLSWFKHTHTHTYKLFDESHDSEFHSIYCQNDDLFMKL